MILPSYAAKYRCCSMRPRHAETFDPQVIEASGRPMRYHADATTDVGGCGEQSGEERQAKRALWMPWRYRSAEGGARGKRGEGSRRGSRGGWWPEGGEQEGEEEGWFGVSGTAGHRG